MAKAEKRDGWKTKSSTEGKIKRWEKFCGEKPCIADGNQIPNLCRDSWISWLQVPLACDEIICRVRNERNSVEILVKRGREGLAELSWETHYRETLPLQFFCRRFLD